MEIQIMNTMTTSSGGILDALNHHVHGSAFFRVYNWERTTYRYVVHSQLHTLRKTDSHKFSSILQCPSGRWCKRTL